MYVSKRLTSQCIALIRDMLTENVTAKKTVYPEFYIIDYVNKEIGVQKEIVKAELEALKAFEQIHPIAENALENEAALKLHLAAEAAAKEKLQAADSADLAKREEAMRAKAKAQAQAKLVAIRGK